MRVTNFTLSIILATSFVFLSAAYAEPTINIIMEKTTYSYCERLFYIIEVSEMTEEFAIIHIRDESGKGSSAIPIEIINLQTPVPSLAAFEAEIFPLGKYFIDVEYSGAEFTAEFNLIDSDNICFSERFKPILTSWVFDSIKVDGFLMNGFQKYVDEKLISIPFEINESNIYGIDIPDWVKDNVGIWWVQGIITDKDFAQVISYLIDENIISTPIETENEI
ncbi:MAG: hypothetical protein QQN41_04585 [Nitrosopumilus sp.]